MKHLLIFFLWFTCINIANASNEHGEETLQIANLIEGKINAIDSGLENQLFFHPIEAPFDLGFTGFEMNIVGSGGVEVPYLSNLEVFVEMEMVWAKK